MPDVGQWQDSYGRPGGGAGAGGGRSVEAHAPAAGVRRLRGDPPPAPPCEGGEKCGRGVVPGWAVSAVGDGHERSRSGAGGGGYSTRPVTLWVEEWSDRNIIFVQIEVGSGRPDEVDPGNLGEDIVQYGHTGSYDPVN